MRRACADGGIDEWHMNAPLKPQHELFAQRVATGDSATAAYRAVYGAGKNADVFGPRLMGNDGIRARVGELQARSATAATLTMQERRKIARAIAVDTTARASDRLAAIMADARLAGELKGDSVTVNATASANAAFLSEQERAEIMERRRAALAMGDDEDRAELPARRQAAIQQRKPGETTNGAN